MIWQETSPEPLQFACQQLDVSPEKAVMIGDSKSDILAAKAANVDGVALGMAITKVKASRFQSRYLCENFLDIIPVLAKVSAF